MKKKMKGIVSILLSAAMLFTGTGINASANEAVDTNEESNESFVTDNVESEAAVALAEVKASTGNVVEYGVEKYPEHPGNIICYLYFNKDTGVIEEIRSKDSYSSEFWLDTLTIPEYIEDVRVTGIGDNAFIKCTYIRYLVIPESVEYISTTAFSETGISKICCAENSSADNMSLYIGSPLIVYEGKSRSDINVSKVLRVENDSRIMDNDSYSSIVITPKREVAKGSEILISIENGSFEESGVEACAFYTKKTYRSYEDMNDGRSYDVVLENYIGNESSRELPYKIEYINSNTIKVTLFWLGEEYAGLVNYDVTFGVPMYNIKLPAISGSETGAVKLSIDGNGTSIENAENIDYAYINGYEADYERQDNQWAEREIYVGSNQQILYNNEPNALVIKPLLGVDENEYITVKIRNGYFDEGLMESCAFLTRYTKVGYDEIMDYYVNKKSDVYNTLIDYIGNEGSRELPYKLEYVDKETIRVQLFPIEDNYVNQKNSDVTYGIPIYKIALPAVAGDKKGYTEVAVSGNNSTSISDGGWYTIARIDDSEAVYNEGSALVINKATVNANEKVETNGQKTILRIQPRTAIGENEKIKISIKNGKFDESLVEECQYRVSTNKGDFTYDSAMELMSRWDLRDVWYYFGMDQKYISTIPYKIAYIDEETIEVSLIMTTENCYIDNRALKYDIELPVVAGSKNGEVSVAVDGNESAIETSGWYTIAEVVNGSTVVKGDISGDGNLNRADSLMLNQYFAGWDNVVINEEAADVNGDGRLNRADKLLLSQYFAGWDVTLG